MRYLQTRIVPEDGGLHPVDEAFATESDLSRELLHNISLLDDETAITLFQLSGDVERARDVVDSSDSVLAYQLSEGETSFTIYAHFVPTETIVELLWLFREHEFILNMPLEYTSDGALTAHIVGEEAVIREVIPKVPASIDVHLEQLTDYQPEEQRLYATLTERQRETLLAALEIGYYEEPREATLQDVADHLDRSDATVGEHLRKIEARIMSAIAP